MMHILSIHELKKKLKSAFKVYSRLIIQEEIQGDEIRVLVAKGRVLLARNRVPAAVIGDGKHSIRKLIAIENQSNPYRGEGYEKPLAFIKIDKELRSYIHKKKLKLRSIPKTGQYIQLRGNSNIGSG
jgi:D-alanine-D-alanine ligase-like ATP-grasp enzyme